MSTYSASGSKHSDSEIDEKIGSYSKLLDTVSDSEKLSFQSKLLSAKLIKQKLDAMTALAKAQAILAEMKVLVAENSLKNALEQLDEFKMEHCESSEKLLKSTKPDTKIKPQKETVSSSKGTPSTSVITSEVDKENARKVEKTTQTNDNHNIDKTHTEKRNKRKRTHRSPSNKKAKRSHKSKNSHNDKSTLITTDTSVINKSKSTTEAIQTCSLYNQPGCPSLEKISDRIIDDDENTVLIEDLSKSKSHGDAVNLSKALQGIMTGKTAGTIPDFTQSPMSYKIQLLFEDEAKEAKKSVKVKTESPENDPLNSSTDNLVNDLFKDIMRAKSKQMAMDVSNHSNMMSETTIICEKILREILEKC